MYLPNLSLTQNFVYLIAFSSLSFSVSPEVSLCHINNDRSLINTKITFIACIADPTTTEDVIDTRPTESNVDVDKTTTVMATKESEGNT